MLRDGVRRVRRRWWHRVVGCWLRLGHQRPLLVDVNNGQWWLECKRCGHTWPDDGGLI